MNRDALWEKYGCTVLGLSTFNALLDDIEREAARSAEPQKRETPSWTHVYSVDEMRAFYESVLPKIREAARECGYAIGVHGSMRRDLDLIAAPWTAEHADKDVLARAIQQAACGIANASYDWTHDPKPCGRMGTVFPICWTEWHDMISAGHIDLAVMPDAGQLERELQARTDELSQARGQIAEYKDDAERYRWWVENYGAEYDSSENMKLFTLVPHGKVSTKPQFDAAIDAARRKVAAQRKD